MTSSGLRGKQVWRRRRRWPHRVPWRGLLLGSTVGGLAALPLCVLFGSLDHSVFAAFAVAVLLVTGLLLGIGSGFLWGVMFPTDQLSRLVLVAGCPILGACLVGAALFAYGAIAGWGTFAIAG